MSYCKLLLKQFSESIFQYSLRRACDDGIDSALITEKVNQISDTVKIIERLLLELDVIFDK